jgi:hypothetical protein
MRKISHILSGVSGEYFVGAELSRRGYIASLTSKNTKGIDILASNEDASKTVGIQVKTYQGSKKSWILSKADQNYYSENICYVFVCLNGTDTPEYHIVPSIEVARSITESHSKWLQTPDKKGNVHNDTNIRSFSDKNDNYLNRWDLLGLD